MLTALVPIVPFWASHAAITRPELADVLSGTSERFHSVAAEPTHATALAASLGVSLRSDLVTGDGAAVLVAVREGQVTLGLVAAQDVGPEVRALEVDGRSLFGNGRLRDLGAWPLLVPALSADGQAFDPARTWTLVAGGDVMLDRTIYRVTQVEGRGADYPWDGGTAEITSRVCCNVLNERLPVARRTGNAGALRALFRDADLAMVNLEGPAPDSFTHHPHGLVFSFDPALLQGLANAGIDYASLGNNHIGNAGRQGVIDTIRHLDALGIEHAGAGADLAEARDPAWFEVEGIRVAVLAYDGVAPWDNATDDRAGNADLRRAYYGPDIAAARTAGADLVIVWPHWGAEYRATPTPGQRRHAAQLIASGADMVIGNHAHWASAMEEIEDRLVFYALGNLIFDLTRSEETLESIVPELTFQGARLVQVRLHPTLVVDLVQPNLLDPSGDGRVVLDQVREASRGLLPW
ncbi:hypothetical protein BH20CHL6_BH20CHL6_02280 [soil metagenome]